MQQAVLRRYARHKYITKCRFKQMCLKTFLKAPVDLHSVTDQGRSPHSLGTAILKARSPKPFNLLRGIANWLETVEHKVRTLVLSWGISLIYSKAWSCRVLYTRSSTLKSILFSTGSQCNDFSTGVVWSNIFDPVNNRILYTLPF